LRLRWVLGARAAWPAGTRAWGRLGATRRLAVHEGVEVDDAARGGVEGADPPPFIGWLTAARGFQLRGCWTARGYSGSFPAVAPTLAPRALFRVAPVPELRKRVFVASWVSPRPPRARDPAVGGVWGGCTSRKHARQVWIHKPQPGISHGPLWGFPTPQGERRRRGGRWLHQTPRSGAVNPPVGHPL